MAAESEMQEFFNKVGHAVINDASIAAKSREAVGDVRDTFHRVFFGQGEGASEPTPAISPGETTGQTPSPGDLAEGKSLGGVHGEQSPAAKQDTASPGDLAEGKGVQPEQQGQTQQQTQRQRLSI